MSRVRRTSVPQHDALVQPREHLTLNPTDTTGSEVNAHRKEAGLFQSIDVVAVSRLPQWTQPSPSRTAQPIVGRMASAVLSCVAPTNPASSSIW